MAPLPTSSSPAAALTRRWTLPRFARCAIPARSSGCRRSMPETMFPWNSGSSFEGRGEACLALLGCDRPDQGEASLAPTTQWGVWEKIQLTWDYGKTHKQIDL